MTIVFVLLVVFGAGVAVWGAIDTYQGRSKPAGEGFYTVPKDSPRGLILALVGTGISLASGLLGIFIA